MAGAGLFKMQPYQWTDTGRLAVEANRNEVQAAASMDKNRNAGQKKSGGIGGSLGGVLGSIGGAALGTMVGMPQVGAMLGGMAGGALGGAIGGGGTGAATGAGEGLGAGMAIGSSDMFKNSGLAPSTPTPSKNAADTALKGAGADGNWSHSFTQDSKNAGMFSNPIAQTTINSLASPGGASTLPWLSGAR